jgi:hypothetical protein
MDRKRLEALENPHIDFTAHVKACELRFDEVPETNVRFWGHPELDSVSGTERKNLPEEVQQGVTYRDVSVRLRIASGLVDTAPDLWERAKEG